MAETSGANSGSKRFENMGKRVDQQLGTAIPWLEEEVKKVITYLNDQIVPNLRKDSAQGLRTAAEQLGKLADRLDASRRPHE